MNASPHPGYAFIPLPTEVDRRPRPQARLDRLDPGGHSGFLSLIWRLEQPLHIGAGFKELVRDQRTPVIVRQHVRLGPIPCVPGSTFKGVLRARYEAITKSCAEPPIRRNASIVSPSSRLGLRARARLHSSASDIPAFQGHCHPERQLCPACALFGLRDLRSRLAIGDARPDRPEVEIHLMPAQYGPRLHHIGDAVVNTQDPEPIFEVTRLYGRKFAVGRDKRPPPDEQRGKTPPPHQRVEALPAGTRLHQRIRFLNLTSAEIGGLLAALGYTPESRLKVGAGKSHGFGRLRLEALEFKLSDRSRELDPARCAADFHQDSGTHRENLKRLVALHGENC